MSLTVIVETMTILITRVYDYLHFPCLVGIPCRKRPMKGGGLSDETKKNRGLVSKHDSSVLTGPERRASQCNGLLPAVVIKARLLPDHRLGAPSVSM